VLWPFTVEVCGHESVNDLSPVVAQYSRANGVIAADKDINTFFETPSSDCNVILYEIFVDNPPTTLYSNVDVSID